MPTSPLNPTATYAALAGGPTRTASAAARQGNRFDEELRRLLRYRLILVNLLGLVGGLLFVVMALLIPEGAQDASIHPSPRQWMAFIALCIAFLTGAVAAWRRPDMSLRSLRLWESVFFASFAAHNAYVRFNLLTDLPETAPEVVITFRGLVSLQGFIPLILVYGVLIPNSRRRSLLVIAGLIAVPFATIPAAAAVNPRLREGHTLALTAQCAFILAFPAAIAVFAAARASALQRRAYEAERQVERLGQYSLQRKLGEGGMGEVWLAEHAMLKRPCAVKFIRPEMAASPAVAVRFEREVQAVTGLTHVNTVRVYDYGRSDDGSFYYVMEYLDGPTLEQLVRDHGPLPPGRVVYLLRQLCGALAEAHTAGLIHRDAKPGNVIVARLGGVCDVAKLLDFGLVLDESATGDGADRLTRAGAVMGTPAYMPPEQAAGEPVDARGDVYALGALGFFALTGRAPFEGKTARQVLAAVLTEPVPPLRGVPADLAAVVSRCLSRDPADRFATIQELGRALAACACGADWSAEQAVAWWVAGSTTRKESMGEETRALG